MTDETANAWEGPAREVARLTLLRALIAVIADASDDPDAFRDDLRLRATDYVGGIHGDGFGASDLDAFRRAFDDELRTLLSSPARGS